ncbi:hypothetical protein DERP_006665 [Dermatophagoides pteronyssinus]|uniref:Uncharacterized protein n=1 Tax=Dermatophagoides pteronyssinus TaxID=6956 RepID=A0ABQ8IQV4_DERPT|nr:hypothetical protein DERP_006665 [Dermatophagoides pteronyssinus]
MYNSFHVCPPPPPLVVVSSLLSSIVLSIKFLLIIIIVTVISRGGSGTSIIIKNKTKIIISVPNGLVIVQVNNAESKRFVSIISKYDIIEFCD